MAAPEGRNLTKVFLLLIMPLLVSCEAKLNVFLEAKEVSRFLYGKQCCLFIDLRK